MRSRFALAAVLLVAVLPAAAQDSAPWLTLDAGEALIGLEAFLLDAEFLRFDIEAQSDSVFTANLAGSMWLAPDGRGRLDASGSFGNGRIDRAFISDGRQMAINLEDDQAHQGETGRELREALILGLTRMGVLHNLARLATTHPPDHADGGVDDWVTTTDVHWLEVGRVLAFRIHVAGNEVADAELHLDAESGLPTHRQQTVRFPGGQMVVEERYTNWTFETLPPEMFVVE